jgi:hypothetical protein
VRGASALGQALANKQVDVTTVVVWEPVLPSDLGPPTSAVVARVPDPCAAQFWDRERVVSAALAGAHVAEKNHRFDVVWDWVGVYPPGVRWNRSPPRPTYQGEPVVRAMEGVRQRLVRALPASN